MSGRADRYTARYAVCALLLLAPIPALAGPFSVSGDERWVVFASRNTQAEAVTVANELSWKDISGLRVLASINGWFAVVSGPVRVPDLRKLKAELLKKGAPPDLLFSRGDNYHAQVWAKFDGNAAVAMRVGNVTVRVQARTGKGDDRFPLATGYEGEQQVFTMALDESPSERVTAEIEALRLDNTPDPQIVFTSFWGGAHCCTMTKIATRAGGVWRVLAAQTLDGGGYSFEDIDRDGTLELVSSDNTFLYAFGPYSDSYAPVQITKVVDGRLVNVTRNPRFTSYIRERLTKQEEYATKESGPWRSNGFLAGWVAMKALAGEFEDGWRRALALYDRNSDWALTECTAARVQGMCPAGAERKLTFPVALRKHLEREGYVSASRMTEPPTPPPPTPRAPAVPTARKGSSSGTGFYVTGNGHIVTNAHVVDDCSSVEVKTGGRSTPAQVIARDRVNDLALLKSDAKPSRIAPLRPTVRLGEPVVAFGYPLSSVLASSGNFTLGHVTALAGIGDDTRYLQISAPVQAGNSGGPLLDDRGNLVGVVTAKLNALKTAALIGDVPQNVNFAIRSSALAGFLASNGLEPQPPSPTAPKSPADLAEEAGSMSAMIVCN
jgi:S1-C subfamily serine protease